MSVSHVAVALERPELLEARLSRILQHFKHVPMAVITAYRTDLYDRTENDRRNSELALDLSKWGYGYMKGRGPWKDTKGKLQPEEPGFIIPSMTLKLARHVADQWDQESFVWTDGDSRGMVYLTASGVALFDAPLNKFTVFAYPEDIKAGGGGAIPSMGKGQKRGFALTAGMPNLGTSVSARFGVTITEDEDDPEPGYYVGAKKGSQAMVSFGCPKFEAKLPIGQLLLVEFDLSEKTKAMINLSSVCVGSFFGDKFLWIRNDGLVSLANGLNSHVLRVAPLVKGVN